MKVNFKVNGQPRAVDVPGDMPLLWTLRDTLELKGTKFGCGLSQCGACTVHVSGAATRSCVPGGGHHDHRRTVERRHARTPARMGGA
jgi:aerobic-type carbon monoxide dehydrogenase small subunit (CoxS/CutS family)